MKILLTGFKSKESITNASDIVVSSFIHDLPESLKSISNNIVIAIINDDTQSVKQSLEEIIIKNKPSYCLFIGQAPGYNRVTLESMATNYRFIAPPLKTGAPPQGDFIEETGDAAYMATLGNLQEMVECIKNKGIPASVSHHCGNSLCNQILYHGLHYAQINGSEMKCGFLHIPALPEQILAQWPQHPFMPLAMSKMAIEIIVSFIYLQHDRNGG